MKRERLGAIVWKEFVQMRRDPATLAHDAGRAGHSAAAVRLRDSHGRPTPADRGLRPEPNAGEPAVHAAARSHRQFPYPARGTLVRRCADAREPGPRARGVRDPAGLCERSQARPAGNRTSAGGRHRSDRFAERHRGGAAGGPAGQPGTARRNSSAPPLRTRRSTCACGRSTTPRCAARYSSCRDSLA